MSFGYPDYGAYGQAMSNLNAQAMRQSRYDGVPMPLDSLSIVEQSITTETEREKQILLITSETE